MQNTLTTHLYHYTYFVRVLYFQVQSIAIVSPLLCCVCRQMCVPSHLVHVYDFSHEDQQKETEWQTQSNYLVEAHCYGRVGLGYTLIGLGNCWAIT